ncbi:uncharacterized protein LOC128723737 [Anopheles nili]|uniref:uncharacterized protein LOC128723737 n=1 Tax=Anopheles nili TaxID=185578 RepID=UPI00237A0F6E|nr:uncharacterized protein LOC128723737 [Anopheles nili]
MKAFCFTLTLLCVVQSILAIPRPDFAISGSISGSATVKQAGIDLSTDAAKVGEKTLTVASGYTSLVTVSDALQAIGDSIVSAASDVGNAIRLLSIDNQGTIDVAFTEVSNKIGTLKTLLAGTFDGKLDSITTITGSYIKNQFKDAFATTTTTLNSLTTALTALKKDVTAAKTAAGNGPITAAHIRANVKPKSVSDVLSFVRSLRSNMPLIRFVIDSSLDNVAAADGFVTDLKVDLLAGIAAYGVNLAAYQQAVTTQGTDVGPKLTTAVGTSPSMILADIQSALDAASWYLSSLSTPLGSLNTALTTEVNTANTAIAASLSTYAGNVPNLQQNLQSTLGTTLCVAIKAVSEVQIANGPYSDFCFSKFSPRVISQITLTVDAIEVCFEKELTRLVSLEGLATMVGQQLAFNTEDLLANMNFCLGITVSDDQATCFKSLKPYYTAIASKASALLTTLKSVVASEATASYNRLGACIIASLGVTSISAAEASSGVRTCLTAGPTA